MAISRLDLPQIREAISALYRVLEKPDSDLSGLSTPNQWKPHRPLWSSRDLPKLNVGNWSPPPWWVTFCTAVGLDPNERPHRHWVKHAVIELVLARLMPTEVHRERECPDITGSSLDFDQQGVLLRVRDELITPFGPHRLMTRPGAALKFRKVLEDVLAALGEPISAPSVHPPHGAGASQPADSQPSTAPTPIQASAGTERLKREGATITQTREADPDELPERARLAYLQYGQATRTITEQGRVSESAVTDEAAFEHLKREGVELPSLETWARYLREARNALGQQKKKRRPKYDGRSAAPPEHFGDRNDD